VCVVKRCFFFHQDIFVDGRDVDAKDVKGQTLLRCAVQSLIDSPPPPTGFSCIFSLIYRVAHMCVGGVDNAAMSDDEPRLAIIVALIRRGTFVNQCGMCNDCPNRCRHQSNGS
jgi:hypothetical protein